MFPFIIPVGVGAFDDPRTNTCGDLTATKKFSIYNVCRGGFSPPENKYLR